MTIFCRGAVATMAIAAIAPFAEASKVSSTVKIHVSFNYYK